MKRNKRKQKSSDYNGGQQHLVMLREPYPLIYNYETGEPAIHIGTLNSVLINSDNELVSESYPIIRPLFLNNEDGEINGSGIVSPYSMFVGEGVEMSAWRHICLLTPRLSIESLFLLFADYCFMEQTMVNDPSDIIQPLQEYGYNIIMPEGEELVICLERDNSGTCWMSDWCLEYYVEGSGIPADLWFLCAGGGSLDANIERMVDTAVYYDGLYLKMGLKLPKYRFVSKDSVDREEIEYINKLFSEWIDKKREKYKL